MTNETTFPEAFRSMSRDEIIAKAKSTDTDDRRLISSTINKHCGIPLNQLLHYSAEDKADKLIAKMTELGMLDKAHAEKKTAAPKTAAAKPAETKAAAAPAGAPAASNAEVLKAIGELSAKLDKVLALTTDGHYLVRVLVMSDPNLNANAEDPSMQEGLAGVLVCGGNASAG